MDGNRPPLAWMGRYGLLLIPLLFLILFFFYPLLAIFVRSFAPDGRLDLGSFREVATSSYYRHILWFTTWQAIRSTVLTLALALPGAYVFVRFRFPGKTLLLSLATLPFVLPTVVVAAAFRALIGRNGLLNDALMSLMGLDNPPIRLERTIAIILIVHVFYNYAIALRIIAGYWANQSARIEEAARILGCHGWRLWWEVRLPILRPAIMAAAVLVFVFTFSSFGVVLILGGGQYATVEVEIYRQAMNMFNLPISAALSLIQIGVMLLMMVIYTRLQHYTIADLQSAQQVARSPKTRGERGLVLGTLIFISVFLFTPLLSLVVRSLVIGGDLTTRYYASLSENPRNSILFIAPTEAISNSLKFALLTTIVSVFLGLLTSYLLASHRQTRLRWLDPVFMLPLAVSAVTLGLGFLLSMDFNGIRDWVSGVLGVNVGGDFDLRSSILIIPLAHTLVAMPFVVRSVLPALESIPPNIGEVAGVLGAPPWKRWLSIELPLISRSIAVGATFAFTISMGEFGASAFVARPESSTMPVAIARLLAQPGLTNYGQALAMSVLLLVVCAASFIVIERVRSVSIGEF